MDAASLTSVSQITNSKPEDKVWELHSSKGVNDYSEKCHWILKQEQQQQQKNDMILWKEALWII